MSTHPGMLIAYDSLNGAIATLSHLVRYSDDSERIPLGLVDFSAHEAAGGEHTDIWSVEGAVGSKVWPEWIGSRAHDFRVELVGPPGGKHIAALVHKISGYRRERAVIEAAIQARITAAGDQPADIRDLVGGPDRPLALDDDGRNAAPLISLRPNLPLVGVR